MEGQWNTSVASSMPVYRNEYFTQIERKSPTHILAYFLTAWTPEGDWITNTARVWPQLDFSLVWYELGSQKYGYYRIYVNGGISETETYQIESDDIVGVDEDGRIDYEDDDAPYGRSSGHFQRILDRVDYVYEESR